MTPQRRLQFQGPARAAAIGGALVVLVSAAAGAVTIWRYEDAVAKHDDALVSRRDRELTQEARTLFWRERESINEYLLAPKPAIKRELDAERTQIHAVTAQIGTGPDSASAGMSIRKSAGFINCCSGMNGLRYSA